MTEAPRVQTYSWDEVTAFVNDLAVATLEIEPRPSVLVGVLRGGALPAVMLSHALGVRTVYALQVATTLSEAPRSRRRKMALDGTEGLRGIEPGSSILVVDDVVNTGQTLRTAAAAVIDACAPHAIRTCALIWDTVGATPGAPCPADFVAHSVEAWIDFPWEIAPLSTATDQRGDIP